MGFMHLSVPQCDIHEGLGEGFQEAEREGHHWEKIGVAGRQQRLLLEMHGHDIKYGWVIFSGWAE